MGATTVQRQEDEAIKTFVWQCHQLVELGFSLNEAEALLSVVRSWHEPADLVAAGATPQEVLGILL